MQQKKQGKPLAEMSRAELEKFTRHLREKVKKLKRQRNTLRTQLSTALRANKVPVDIANAA